MSKMRFCTAAGAAVLSLSTLTMADQIRITFNDVDGVATSLWDGTDGNATEGQFGGSNTGADPSFRAYLTLPNENDGFPVALYRPVLPANFAGATINSATFTARDANFNGGGPTTNVELRRINLPNATWDPGDGTRGTRFTNPDNGAQMFWADFDVANNQGIDWEGNLQPGPWSGGGTSGGSDTDFRTTALADLIDAETLNGSGLQATWDVMTLVQNWADGTWDIDGFALSTLNSTGATGGYQIDTSGTTERGLIIDYTPVPEPTTFGLLGAGALMFLRRRRTA